MEKGDPRRDDDYSDVSGDEMDGVQSTASCQSTTAIQSSASASAYGGASHRSIQQQRQKRRTRQQTYQDTEERNNNNNNNNNNTLTFFENIVRLANAPESLAEGVVALVETLQQPYGDFVYCSKHGVISEAVPVAICASPYEIGRADNRTPACQLCTPGKQLIDVVQKLIAESDDPKYHLDRVKKARTEMAKMYSLSQRVQHDEARVTALREHEYILTRHWIAYETIMWEEATCVRQTLKEYAEKGLISKIMEYDMGRDVEFDDQEVDEKEIEVLLDKLKDFRAYQTELTARRPASDGHSRVSRLALMLCPVHSGKIGDGTPWRASLTWYNPACFVCPINTGRANATATESGRASALASGAAVLCYGRGTEQVMQLTV
jgi:hypothetical protein